MVNSCNLPRKLVQEADRETMDKENEKCEFDLP